MKNFIVLVDNEKKVIIDASEVKCVHAFNYADEETKILLNGNSSVRVNLCIDVVLEKLGIAIL
ncbi:hypothetical protein LOZ86_16425 [Pectobacterium parvum]|uniref:hypothetical protein n=1 Tax=Pectobacterium parvum TaxID=2778550 RepID=UPI001E2B6236|nr:hypothetical protein [Pectobacterium parvum]UFK38496.1 hypothetical protein LOZ86_16425 [Pectobacterium parvum]GKW43269.1 hypothetical protein PEC301879_31270 [Pectobacterium carotovorum subsp. carotovorum]